MKEDTSAVRREPAAALEQRRKLDLSKENVDWNLLRCGWCYGPKTFREELLELIGDQRGEQHCGEEVRESEEQKAGQLIAQALKKLRWTADDLKNRRKGDAIKAGLANRLRTETTVTWRWIAQQLAMGHWRTARNAARKSERKRK